MSQPEEERIGKYRVHPVASIFPLLEGYKYEELRVSIEELGQQHPLIVQGDMLLDGRNRLRVCLELDIEPLVQQYHGQLPPVDYIMASNLDRRHLDDDTRAAICAKIDQWSLVERAARFKAEQGYHGVEGGRGKKKTLTTKSGEGFPEPSVPESRERHARETVGQLAKTAKVSHHKAAQAVAVAKGAPDLLDRVVNGVLDLNAAQKEMKARPPAPDASPRKPPKARPYKIESAVASCARKISHAIDECPSARRAEFKTLLMKECVCLCQNQK